MNCYDCASDEKTTEAVGVCAVCGAGVCSEHAVVQTLAQWRNTGSGIGGPYVRAPKDQRRFVCRDCEQSSSQ